MLSDVFLLQWKAPGAVLYSPSPGLSGLLFWHLIFIYWGWMEWCHATGSRRLPCVFGLTRVLFGCIHASDISSSILWGVSYLIRPHVEIRHVNNDQKIHCLQVREHVKELFNK